MLAIGVGIAGKFVEIIHGDEAIVLGQWWGYASSVVNQDGLLAGYCIESFDLPFLLRRSWILGVEVPSWIRSGRYFDRSFVDIAMIWACGRREAIQSLDTVARSLGVGRKNGKGADFAALFANSETRAKAIEYLENDIKLTIGVAERLGVGKEAA